MDTAALDGVIKYSSERVAGALPPCARLAELNQLRTELFDLGLIGVYPDGVGYGNLSIRTAGDQFLITGSATGAQRVLHADDYCLVEWFSMTENRVRARGSLDASSESMTHGAIYANQALVQCVAHIHSRRLFDALLHQASVPSTDARIAYGTPEMAYAVAQLLQEAKVLPLLFVMAGHDEGLVACGTDVASVRALLLDIFGKTLEP